MHDAVLDVLGARVLIGHVPHVRPLCAGPREELVEVERTTVAVFLTPREAPHVREVDPVDVRGVPTNGPNEHRTKARGVQARGARGVPLPQRATRRDIRRVDRAVHGARHGRRREPVPGAARHHVEHLEAVVESKEMELTIVAAGRHQRRAVTIGLLELPIPRAREVQLRRHQRRQLRVEELAQLGLARLSVEEATPTEVSVHELPDPLQLRRNGVGVASDTRHRLQSGRSHGPAERARLVEDLGTGRAEHHEVGASIVGPGQRATRIRAAIAGCEDRLEPRTADHVPGAGLVHTAAAHHVAAVVYALDATVTERIAAPGDLGEGVHAPLHDLVPVVVEVGLVAPARRGDERACVRDDAGLRIVDDVLERAPQLPFVVGAEEAAADAVDAHAGRARSRDLLQLVADAVITPGRVVVVRERAECHDEDRHAQLPKARRVGRRGLVGEALGHPAGPRGRVHGRAVDRLQTGALPLDTVDQAVRGRVTRLAAGVVRRALVDNHDHRLLSTGKRRVAARCRLTLEVVDGIRQGRGDRGFARRGHAAHPLHDKGVVPRQVCARLAHVRPEVQRGVIAPPRSHEAAERRGFVPDAQVHEETGAIEALRLSGVPSEKEAVQRPVLDRVEVRGHEEFRGCTRQCGIETDVELPRVREEPVLALAALRVPVERHKTPAHAVLRGVDQAVLGEGVAGFESGDVPQRREEAVLVEEAAGIRTAGLPERTLARAHVADAAHRLVPTHDRVEAARLVDPRLPRVRDGAAQRRRVGLPAPVPLGGLEGRPARQDPFDGLEAASRVGLTGDTLRTRRRADRPQRATGLLVEVDRELHRSARPDEHHHVGLRSTGRELRPRRQGREGEDSHEQLQVGAFHRTHTSCGTLRSRKTAFRRCSA